MMSLMAMFGHGLIKAVTASLLVGAFALAASTGASIAYADGVRVHKASGLGPRCRLLKIGSVSFMDGGKKRGWYLYVGGMRRFSNMDVGFEHRGFKGGVLTVEAVGCTANFLALPIPTPYNIELPLRDIPGARAIRIIGSNGAVTRRLPGR